MLPLVWPALGLTLLLTERWERPGSVKWRAPTRRLVCPMREPPSEPLVQMREPPSEPPL